jgi:hypothetical protein
MCLGKACSFEECHFQHHRAYRSQPWFTSDEHEWEDDVKYTWRTEKPKIRKSEKNKEEQPKPTKQEKAKSDSNSYRGSTSNMSIAPSQRDEPHLPQVPENSSSKQSQPAEALEEAPASKEERKEVPKSTPQEEAPSSTPPSEQQNQPAKEKETKVKSTAVVSPEHSTDDEIEMVLETEEHKQARIEKTNATATWRNMPKDSTQAQRQTWKKVWLDRFDQEQLQLQEEQEQVDSFLKRPMQEDLDAALELLCLPPCASSHFRCEDFLKQLEGARRKNFQTQMGRYSTDKIGKPDSDGMNPDGEDCSTPEKKAQAWKDRAQKVVNAQDTINLAAKWGVKKLTTGEDGKQVWI